MSGYKHLEESLSKKLDELYGENPWMKPEVLSRLALRVSRENASQVSRRRQLVQMADRLNGALAPKAACKAGCSHCCSMTTMIYEHEAVAIAKFSGRAMRRVPRRRHDVALEQALLHFGTPCPFLVDFKCSVYEVRPLLCRLHHSLNDDAAACDLAVPADERKPVTSYDVDVIELPYHLLVNEQSKVEPWGAIQEFFPAGR